jgi:hypothetical protein
MNRIFHTSCKSIFVLACFFFSIRTMAQEADTSALQTSADTIFEGELEYRNTFIDRESFQRMFEDVTELLSIKGPLTKTEYPKHQPGNLFFQIIDAEKKITYELRKVKSVRDSMATDSLTQMVYDTAWQVYRKPLCKTGPEPRMPVPRIFSGLRLLDTVMIIAGLPCHVAEDVKDGVRVGEYFYCDSIKLDPAYYDCRRTDGDDRLYKFTNGSLITRRVLYDVEAYIYVKELQAIRRKIIEPDCFELPPDIQIVDQ